MHPSTIIQEILDRWLLFSLATTICYFVGAAIYNLFLSSLAKYPGPFLAKISSLPSFYYATRGYRHIWIWQCHQIYGDTFRFKPNGIMVNTPTGYSAILSNKANVRKTRFYEASAKDSTSANTFQTIDKLAHAPKRRTLNSVFSEKSLRSTEPFIHKHVNRWCELLLDGDGKEWSKPRDMVHWSDYLVFDILCELCFGNSFEIKEPGDNPFKAIPKAIATYIAFISPIAISPMAGTFIWFKNRGLNYLLDLITPKDVKDFESFVAESVAMRRKKAEEQEKQGLSEDEVRKDMFYYLFQAKGPNGEPAYSPKELESEANLLVVAGSDTTSIVLCALFFYLTRYPHVYTKLIKEIRNTFQSIDEIHSGATLTSCQYLRACIDETMRMNVPLTTELPREVLSGGLEIDGQYIPEGTTVGTCGWAFTHNEEVFQDPEIYRPERWIVDETSGVTTEDVDRAKSAFFPFSSGPTNCVGKNLAILELLITAAKTLYQMDVRAFPGDTRGEGSPELGWGRRNRKQYQVFDAYLALRDGPVVQFRKRED